MPLNPKWSFQYVLTIHPPIGVDDVMAMLLALSAKPEEMEVAMLSVTYGNVPLQRYDLLCVNPHVSRNVANI